MRPFGDREVEARIVNEDQHVGDIVGNILTAEREILTDLAKMSQHIPNTHYSSIAVMPNEGTSDGRHEVATPKAEIGLGILMEERLHQI